MDFSEIELIALRDVWLTRLRRPGASEDFMVRRIFREYSQKFHTALHLVYELPIEFVVQAWMEEVYEDYKDEDLLAEAKKLLQPIDQMLAERRREDEDEAEMFLLGQDVKRSEEAAKKMEEAVKALSAATKALTPTHEEKVTGSRRAPEAQLANKHVEPGRKISMSFENVDLDQDSFGLLDTPAPKSPNAK